MLKATDKGKKALLVFESSSSSSDSEEDSKEVKIRKKKKGALLEKGKQNGKSDDKATTKGFTINKGYADRYDNWRNLEEMQKLKNRLGINDISELKEEDSSSESSSEEEEWSTEKEMAFYKTLACLKTKDPEIYNDQFGFFKDTETASNDTKSSKTKDQGKKPFTVRDHERTMILDKAGASSDEDDDDDGNKSSQLKSYPEELASIKSEFSKALNEIDSSDEEENGGNLLGSKLLKRRANKSEEEKQKDNEDYKLWLKGELQKVDKGKLSKADEKQFKSLREYWNDDKLDEGEKFLRDYILNKKYIDPLKADKDYIPSYSEVVGDADLSDDEKFEAEREEFEHKYNFRFEEPDQDFIKRYPRTIQESLRREDSTRKEQRQKTKNRKEEEKARKKDEVQRLKALKRREIMDKIQKLHEISGDPSLDLSEVDIDGDFDPEEYDRRMQQIFNENYYQEEADEEKPVFEYDPEIDDEENWEKWVPPRGEDDVTIKVEKEDSEDMDDDDGDDEESSEQKKEEADFFGRRQRRAAAQQEMIEASKSKRGRKKRSVFLDALEREKPKFDPKVHKSFEKYFEEYYKLDFEDIVGGDVKCRFKYHKTTANDFGLTTAEILKAEDKELNQWASLKKTFQYRGDDEEQYEVQAYKKKAEREDLKKRVLLSVYQPTPDDKATQESDSDEEEQEKQKKKRKKKNKKKNKIAQDQGNNNDNDISSIETHGAVVDTASSETPRKKIKKEPKSSSQSPEKPAAKLAKKQESSAQSTPETAKLSKRQRKNKKRLNRSDTNGESLTAAVAASPVKNETSKKSNKKRYFDEDSNNKRGKERKAAAGANEKNELDDDRLRSYGLNPKKFKKQKKYGSSSAARV